MLVGRNLTEKQKEEINLEVLDYCLEHELDSLLKPIAYLSCPLTSGKLFDNWKKSKNIENYGDLLDADELTKESFDKNVLEVNKKSAIKFQTELRKKYRMHIINPAQLKPNAVQQLWSFEQWMYFWLKVIEKHVDVVFFAPGWNMSKGCTIEKDIALRNNLNLIFV